MASMVVCDFRIVGQVGKMIGLGPLFDHSAGAVLHDAVSCRDAGTLVLVAAEPSLASGHYEDNTPSCANLLLRSANLLLRFMKYWVLKT